MANRSMELGSGIGPWGVWEARLTWVENKDSGTVKMTPLVKWSAEVHITVFETQVRGGAVEQ